MRIAICDDEKSITGQIEIYIRNFFGDAKNTLDIDVFSNPVLLLEGFFADKYDIIFLDVQMGDINGVDIAAQIRDTDSTAPIIFITGYEKYSLNAFKVHAFFYVLKPVNQEKISDVINRLLRAKKISVEDVPYFTYKSKGVMERIALNNILYFEQDQNRTFIHPDIGQRIEIYGSLKAALTQLEKISDDFYCCHKKYIVNMYKIKTRKRDYCIINNGTEDIEIPVGSTQKMKFKETHTVHIKKQGGMPIV